MDGQTPDPQPQSPQPPDANPVPDIPAGRVLARIDGIFMFIPTAPPWRQCWKITFTVVDPPQYFGFKAEKIISVKTEEENDEKAMKYLKGDLQCLGWQGDLSSFADLTDDFVYQHHWITVSRSKKGEIYGNFIYGLGPVPISEVPDPPELPDVNLVPPTADVSPETLH